MLIDLEVLWDEVSDATMHYLNYQICGTCENKCEQACEECHWICDNKKNVVHRSHYYNSRDEV